MTDSRGGYQQFFAELKRRHVFRVAAVYGFVSFGLIQFADPLAKSLLLPDVFLTYVSATLLLGFPLALVLAWAFEVTPDGVRRTADAAPGVIEEIIAQPASKRWPSGLMAFVGVIALIAGAVWVGRRTAATNPAVGAVEQNPSRGLRLAYLDPADDPRPSLAVLPFADMSREGDQEYFSDGITEELLNTLVRIRQLRVAARTSAFAFKDRQVDVRQVGDSLGVDYLIEGSVRKAGSRLRITAQLIDTADGSHLWSDQYDREMDDIFAIQTEIAEAIAGALTVPLGLEEGERLVTPAADLEAYDLYLVGRARMRERGASVPEAVELFEAAIARDSTWAPAWAGLAESRSLMPFYVPGANGLEASLDSAFWADQLSAAEVAAKTALALDPENASATVALANAYRDQWRWKEAEAAYVQALTTDPDNVEAHQQYAELLVYVGRADEAMREARRALALDRSPIRLLIAGYVSVFNGLNADAIDLLEEAVRIDSAGALPWPRGFLLSAYAAARQWEKVRSLGLELTASFAPEHLAEIRRSLSPTNTAPVALDADLLLPLPRGHLLAAQFWMVMAEPERALRVLERTNELPPFGTTTDFWHPSLDPLRDDARLEALLRRRGLAGRRPSRVEP